MEQARREGFKFRRAVLENCFTVPGDGYVNFPAVFKILDKVGYESRLLVEAEQDPAISNPFEYALKARTHCDIKPVASLKFERFFLLTEKALQCWN